jgi:2',3'-cyclic-nucleotide 2'-phosphodiesterase (5'-nucleotidase family)
MVVDAGAPVGNRVRDVRVNGQPLDPNKTYTVAIPDYALKEGDGYTMFKGQPLRVGPEAGTLISGAIEKYVATTREIASSIDGRITIR